MKKIVQTLLLLFAVSSISNAQSCDLQVPSGSWSGETTVGTGGTYASSTVTVSATGSQVTVSDFSAGFISHFGDNSDYTRQISFSCNGQMISQEFSSGYGAIKLTSGTWDDANQKITIHWEIPSSGINETTILTYAGQ